MSKIQSYKDLDQMVVDAAVDEIHIKGARANNLKNIEIHIPKNKLVVVTGVSGSGKSSLSMDTLYAEGQRRYVESLSSYARQFLGRMKKPDVDFIKGLCPAIAIEQKVSTSNARSTVGSLTEVYDYLRLLYARIGHTISPVSGQDVKRHSVSDVVDYIHEFEDNSKVQLFIPLHRKYRRTLGRELDLLLQRGYNRLLLDDHLVYIEDILEGEELDLEAYTDEIKDHNIQVLIDRFMVKNEDEENIKRIADSVQTAFYESEGDCIIEVQDKPVKMFNNRFELDGIEFLEPNPQLFNYNNPYGACPKCEGYGKIMGISEEKVIPDPRKSVYEGAIACWSGEKLGKWLSRLIKVAHEFDFPIHRPYKDLTDDEKDLLWDGNEYFRGINDFFDELEEKTYKIQNRVLLARYRGKTRCNICHGGRLRKEANYVKIGEKAITELVCLPVDELMMFFDKVQLNETDEAIARRLLLEINTRLEYMIDLGLSYLSLDRISSTLSGGETQRLNLTRTLGSNLTNSMYILDEPSVGLHSRDSDRLIRVLKALRDLGNTVIVVEHEEDIIRNADFLVDMGPGAGVHGGEIVYAGDYEKIKTEAKDSLTTKYMTGQMEIPVPQKRRKTSDAIWIKGARQHNLQDIDVKIPLNAITIVSGVSGSGKSTLIKDILYPALLKQLGENYRSSAGQFNKLEGDLDQITKIEFISQNPIGKSSRSNPVTYVKAYDAIRKLMSDQQLSRIRGFKPKHFSFNVEGGRCEACKGEGEQLIEMQFLADIRLECEDCGGKRFKQEVLDVEYRSKNIYDVLSLSIEEAMDFFSDVPEIIQKLKPLHDVGLGYIKLGQSSSTLSGGEAQRVKLAAFLGKERRNEHILFIFDEPTTGLHFHDIRRLLDAFNALVEQGHSIIIIEHNLDVIKAGDWLVDLGPGGGKYGGKLLFQGIPEDILKCKESITAQYLEEKL